MATQVQILETRVQCPLLPERYSKLKQTLIQPAHKQAVIESYDRLKQALAVEAEFIAKLGPKAVPEIDFADVRANGGQLPEAAAELVRERGCIILRNVIPEAQATAWETELREYTKRHSKVGGYPVHDPQNWSLYWTPPQVQMRSHPNVLEATNAVSKLWHVSDPSMPVDFTSQVAYADRFRIRHPSEDEYPLKAHQDTGAIERWEDPMYKGCYQAIFEGRWDDYDAWCADNRPDAKTDLYALGASCSVWRSMQGWLSLSNTNTGEGTLRLVPNVKLTSAYLMLRPFFVGTETFDDVTPTFPGASPGNCQFLPTRELHPHLSLDKVMVGIPPVRPGDYVFWHCDLVHEVDAMHPGINDSSVSYNACVPLCTYNIGNMLRMREAFEGIKPPADFGGYQHLEEENKHDDHGARKENIISEGGLRAMGFARFDEDEEGLSEGQKRVRREANIALGFA